ncbi:unnamed protein product [Enterobius vermicularis]|uniref:MICOS complex subunit MIC13 n=1 Tax=Enterobius vermicularis TaxID=51028 RepID=A0A0N4V1A9_ENTVE|nr:unnamed protein product [Enterobius vermicularis]
MSFVWKLTKAGIKIGVVYAAVKLSLDYDIWSLNTGKGADNYNRLQKTIMPGLQVFSNLPSTSEMGERIEKSWNCGVKKFFNAFDSSRPRAKCS